MEYVRDIIKSFPRYPSMFWGLLFIIVIVLSPLELLLNQLIDQAYLRFIIYASIIIGWILFWLYNFRRWPHNKPNKIGIAVGIRAENDKQKIRLKNDFIFRLNELIKDNKLETIIQVLSLDDFQTDKFYDIQDKSTKRFNEKLAGVDQFKVTSIEKKWNKLKNNLGAHFYIWGDVKERKDGELKYFLDLNARVIHPPIIIGETNPFAEAFKYIWHKKISFGENIELKGFQFTADVVFIAVKYVIGIAAFISKDAFTALRLHESLIQDLKKFNPLPPNLVYVQKDLLKRLADECGVIATYYRLQNNKQKGKEYVEKCINYNPHNTDAYNLKSLFDFLLNNDVEEAIRSCHLAEKYAKKNGTWRYNLGFLLMYKERFEEALKVYDEIAKTTFDEELETLNEIYFFNDDFVKQHSNKSQSYFIIGFLKYHKNKNLPEALDYLTRFLKKVENNNKSKLLIDKSTKYIKEINKKMGL